MTSKQQINLFKEDFMAELKDIIDMIPEELTEACRMLDEGQHKENVPSFFLKPEELEQSFKENVLNVIKKIPNNKQ